MKKSIIITTIAAMVLGCTSDFEKFNKDQYGIGSEELNRIPQGGNQLIDLQKLVLPEQENSYQMCFDMVSSYSGLATTKFTDDYQTYNPRSGWIGYLFNDTYPKIYTAFNELKSISKGDYNKPYFALGSIYRVAITHWLTDTYGPLPYSQMKEAKGKVPYDSQKDLYLTFCDELTKSIEGLEKVDPNDREYAPFDYVYKGDMQKWIKYANSLLLRISIRMGKVAPTEAKMYAEQAVRKGVITSNADNAQLETADNPAFKTSAIWGDSRVGADITEYMNAFSDPRRAKYFTEVTSRTTPYFGCRSGAPNITFQAGNYSLPNIQKNSPIMWISAAEVAFLKAEGALNGWAMGNTAEELYKQGVQLSFEQWGAGDATAYLTDSNQRGAFSDEKNSGYDDASFSSEITVNWGDANGDTEKQLARIITQKWIALYPYGLQEGWAEWRRTGYPNLLRPVENKSGGIVQNITRDSNGKDRGGMRRLPYSDKEYTSDNMSNIQQAVQYLGGNDNGATDLWWAK